MRVSLNLIVAACLTGLWGCGSSGESPQSDADANSKSSTASKQNPPSADSRAGSGPADQSPMSVVTVSVPNPVSVPDAGAKSNSGSTDESVEPDKAAQILKEIQQVRFSPLPTDLEQAREARRERNLQIIDLATAVLQLTIQDDERKPQFHQAIGQLLEARYQLALAGTQDDIDLLFADVQALNEQDAESIPAAEGIYYLAKFAHTKARLQGRGNSMWFENFSRWAREFADRFPNQSERAISLLFGAGRSCEMFAMASTEPDEAARLWAESKLCYTSLAENWGSTSQGQEATAVLRRMALPGKKLSQFAGPTLDGGYVDAEQFVGKITVIYFWESQSEEFQKDLMPLLQQASKAASGRLRFVGVNLDDEELELEHFLESNTVPGSQIFFTTTEQRSWNSPLMRFWGVSKIPSVWLVDDQGIVKAVDVSAGNLVAEMRKMF